MALGQALLVARDTFFGHACRKSLIDDFSLQRSAPIAAVTALHHSDRESQLRRIFDFTRLQIKPARRLPQHTIFLKTVHEP